MSEKTYNVLDEQPHGKGTVKYGNRGKGVASK